MPENNEPQYELDNDYAPIGIVDAADGSGTTWSEFVEQVGKMDNQVAALTEVADSQSKKLLLADGVTTINAANASGGGVYKPMLIWIFGDKKFGVFLDFTTKKINCINYVDRSKDFTVP